MTSLPPTILATLSYLLCSCSSQLDLGSDYGPPASGGSPQNTAETSSGGATQAKSDTGGGDAEVENADDLTSESQTPSDANSTEKVLCDPNLPDCALDCSTSEIDNCPDGLLDVDCNCWQPCDESYCMRCGTELCEVEETCVAGTCTETDGEEHQSDDYN